MKKCSVLFVAMLLAQTLVSPTLSFAQETLSEVVPIEKEEVLQKGQHGTANWFLHSDGTLTFEKGVLGESSLFSGSLYATFGATGSKEIKKIVFTEPITANTQQAVFFAGLENLKTIEGLELWNTSNTIDMSDMFYKASSLTSLDLSGFDTSKVTNMSNMFYGASSLTSLDLSSFNTLQVANMSWMFRNASSLTSLDISTWATSQIADVVDMFSGASKLQEIKLGDETSFPNRTTFLPNPPEDSFYTGSWTATDDAKLTYRSSADLLENGTQKKGSKTFIWAPRSYTVAFNLGGGTGGPSEQEIKVGTQIVKPENAPKKAGYEFLGWFQKDEDTPWDFDNDKMPASNLTLYARWAAVYTVTFKNSDGKVLKTQSVVHGNNAQAPTNTTRKDYSFTGWDKAFNNVTSHLIVTAKHKAVNVSFKPSVTSKTIGKKKSHTLSVKSLNVEKNRTEYTIDKKYSKLASVNKTTGKVTTKDKAGTFKVNVKVIATNGTSKTMTVTYKTIHHVTDVLTDKGKKLATKASLKKGKTTTIKTKAISSKKTQKATSPKMTFATSNKKVATVDKKGKIKGVKKGTATITITTTTADGAKVMKKVKVTVK